ncbi:MAG: 1-deoxy-D-xylulose-5-phosphate reductoisomerase [Flavobacteriales bacterium]|nr:1-deoxy-D-xylulose-5-phosphate reductoisomerase [Flavobacteriales bacterium]
MSEKHSKHVAVIGSTGYLGIQTLEVISRYSDQFVVEVLSAKKNAKLLAEQALKFNPNVVVIADNSEYNWLKDQLFDHGIKVYCGEPAIADVVQIEDIDVVLNAQLGVSGIEVSLKTVEAGKDLALANRESLVIAGELLTKTAQIHRANILPLGLGHSAILQSLAGEYQNKIARLYLTHPRLEENTPHEQLLKSVEKQTIREQSQVVNEATFFRNGFELIEAKWLYGVEPQRVDFLHHPENVCHGMVKFVDGSVKTVMSSRDIGLPIQFALSFPTRLAPESSGFSFEDQLILSFDKTNIKKEKSVKLCEAALESGGLAPCILNASNDIAVEAFLNGRMSLSEIPNFVEECLEQIDKNPKQNIGDYLSFDFETRKRVSELLKSKAY